MLIYKKQLPHRHVCTCLKPGPGILSYVMLFLYSVSEGDRWSLFCWYWWNWWPSLFKLSFHKCTGMHSFCWYWWNCWPSLLILSYHNLIVNIFTNLIICLPVSKRKFFICGYSSLQKNAKRFTHMWKALAWLHHFNK